MNETGPLLRLARALGIEPEYQDIWGRTHALEPGTARALLSAMGVPATDDDEAAEALARREEDGWRRALPPVVMARRSAGRIEVPVVVAASDEGAAHRWRVAEEDGNVREGRFVPADLAAEGAREVDGRARVRRRLVVAGTLPLGYHRLEVGAEGPDAPRASTRLVVVPDRCYVPDGLARGGRTWGPAAQVYALRGGRDWGAGDLSTLARLVEVAGRAGAGIVGVNPLHALFPERPGQASPYSPSTRLFLNPVYVDVEAVPELETCPEAQARIDASDHRARRLAARTGALVDWPEVAALKREVLEILWAHFRERHLDRDTPRGRAFEAFRRARGEALSGFAVFEALERHFRRVDPALWGWPVWPEAYRRADSPEVAAWREAHPDEVGFVEYVQLLADEQLAAVGRRALDLGLRVGLYQDLAVGVDRSGFECWWQPELFARGAGFGAPPDDFNLKGQDWGLPPWVPSRLSAAGYEPFSACLRSAMRHAGALRVDHVMALLRLFWIPPGRGAAEGAYVRYPVDDLLGILALESVRNQCLVIGEDLGTVPDEIRTRLRDLGALSYRLLVFLKDESGAYLAPAELPRQALVAVTTHDLPTLAGWWEGVDLALRDSLDLFPSDEVRAEQVQARAEDRARLLHALERAGLLPAGRGADLSAWPEMTTELAAAVHRYVARGPSMVVTVQLEDVLGVTEQVNLPGTTEARYPSWRRRLPATVDELAADPRFRALAASLRAER